MEEMDVIDRFLETFITYIDSGFGLLAGDVAYLTTTLIAIDITLAGLFWALSENSDVIAGLIRKVLYVGFFAYLIGNFQLLSGILFESFAALGIKAGSGTLTPDDLLRPGYIAGIGFEAALPLLDEAGSLLGPIAFFHNFVLISVLIIAWAIILAAFFILAVQLFIAVLEFKLTTLAGFILVPFALWNRTAFLAERVLGSVITSGIKLMVLAVIIGIGSTLFSAVTGAFTGGEDLTLADVMGTVLAATVFLWMGVFGPGIASAKPSGPAVWRTPSSLTRPARPACSSTSPPASAPWPKPRARRRPAPPPNSWPGPRAAPAPAVLRRKARRTKTSRPARSPLRPARRRPARAIPTRWSRWSRPIPSLPARRCPPRS